MVTLAVAAAVGGGFLTAGSTSAVIAGLAATVIDQYVVSPALFPPDDQEGPRLNDFSFGSGSEHTPQYLAFGEDVSVPVTWVWIGPLQEKKNEKDVGKGGGGSITSYKYFLDCDGAVCDNEIEEIEEIRGDGKLIYGINEDQNVTSDLLGVTKEELLDAEGNVMQTIQLISTTSSGPNLKKFKSGKDVVVTGYTTSANNGTFKCISGTKNKSTGDSFLRLDNPAVVAEVAGDTVTLAQGAEDLQINKAASIEFYEGTTTQLASTIISSEEGASLTPASRGRAHFVVDRFGITPFGNRLPQVRARVREETAKTVASTITALLTKLTDLESSSWDVTDTGLTSDNMRGYAVRGPTPAAKALQPIMVAYDILAQEDQGVLKFFKRENGTAVTVAVTDLVAGPENEQGATPFQVMPIPKHQLPSEVNVGYKDPLSNLQEGSQRYKKLDREMENVRDIRLPLTMIATEAKSLAQRLCWTAWSTRVKVVMSLPPKYMHIREGDRISFDEDVFDREWTIIVTKVDIGADFSMKVEGVQDDASTLSSFSNSVADDPTDPDPLGPYVPPLSWTFLLNLPPMQAAHETVPGFYSAVAAADFTSQWMGAKVYSSFTSGGTFAERYDVIDEATIGLTTTALGAPSQTHLYWDNESSVTVRLIDGELDSKTKIEVLNGGNRMVIGKEIIGFVTATIAGLNTYTLSGLLRGLRDTDDHMSGHAIGEQVVHLNSLGVEFIDGSLIEADPSLTRYYKAISDGAAVTDFDNETPFINTAETLMPFRPTAVKASRDGSNNITISWVRRTRSLIRVLDMTSGEPQLDLAGWEVDILTGSGGTLLRTITDTGTGDAPSVSYTAAQQTTDGLTPGDKIWCRVYKISESVGRGNYTEANI
jgi:hypothetical protein